MADSDTHPDILALEALRASEPDDPAAAAHAAACSDCRAAVAELAALARELKARHGPAPAPTPEIDAQILRRARSRALRVRRAGMRDTWRAVWAVAAAAILVLASALLYARHARPSPGQGLTRPGEPPVLASRAAADIDGDGRVTVLDAFALARALEKTPVGTGADVDRDSRFDEHDVDAVMAMAVSVRGT